MRAEEDNPNRAEATGARYRPDIDGLRALAVLPVVFYHFGIPPFTGGYVGVDVFFVISGFLITSLIHTEMRRGAFSFVSFYERRIRRVFPALMTVLLATVVIGSVLLLPRDLIRYGGSLMATVIFGSNFRFWHEAGYFDVAAELKPLLHTWSLAVEEQFYLLFPPILYAASRAGRPILLAVLGFILAASLAASLWAVGVSPSAAFYLLPARMWELMIGAVLAIGGWSPPRRVVAELCTAAGVALIAVAVFAYDAATPFPGLAALPPCLGAGLVIYGGSGERSMMRDALAWRGVVFTGLISYSLYLWHWPILVFARYDSFAPSSLWVKFALVLLSVVLAVLSWRYVERPFRGRGSAIGRRTVFGGGVAAMAVLALIGAVPKWTHGLPQRFPEDVRAIFVGADDESFRHCSIRTVDQVRQGKLCRLGVKNAGPPRFILWGDSHAGSVAGAVNEVAARRNLTGLLATYPACPPLLGVTPHAGNRALGACPLVNDAVRKIAGDPSISLVILAGRWALNAEGTGYREDVPSLRLLTDGETPAPSLASDHAVFERGLRRTVESLAKAGKKIVIVAGVPEIGPDVPDTLARAKLRGVAIDIRPRLDDYLARQRFVLGVLDRLARDFGIAVVYPHQVLCASGRCAIEIGGRPLYGDGQHLTDLGAAQLIPLFEPVIR